MKSVLLAAGIAMAAITTASAAEYTIGLSNGWVGSEWRTQMIEEAQAAAKAWADKGVKVNVVVQSANVDVQGQIGNVRNFINQGVNAIIINPNSPTAFDPIFAQAKAKGILVVATDAEVSSKDAIYVGIDQKGWAMKSAEWLAKTLDGKEVLIKANIEVPEETDSVLRHGAQGIGLFRSEFLFLQPGRAPSEESQYVAYGRVIEAMGDRPVTIRTLDVGGDKVVPDLAIEEEKNPLLGWRAIRYCLSDKELFQSQLRAILRASVSGDARIMFPMISGPVELDSALAQLEAAKAECRRRGQSFREDIPVGIMIEVPSAAMIADILAPKVDFFSIGTNDLIQYTIAVDRGNERVAYLHEPFHPAVVRLVKKVIDDGHAAGIPVSMCGEMASDPFAAVVLLGLGLDEFSMSAVSVPDVKRTIRSIGFAEARAVADEVLKLGSHRETEEYLAKRLADRVSRED